MATRPEPFNVNEAREDRVYGDPTASFLLVGFEKISAQLDYLIGLLESSDQQPKSVICDECQMETEVWFQGNVRGMRCSFCEGCVAFHSGDVDG